MRIKLQVAIAVLALYWAAAWLRPSSSAARASARANVRANARTSADPTPTVDGAPEPPVRTAPVQPKIARVKPLPHAERAAQLRPPPVALAAAPPVLLAPRVVSGEEAYAPGAEPVSEALPVPQVAMDRMRERWESEHDDPEWSDNERATAEALLDLFALPEEWLLDVSCRTTVCRIAVDANDVARLVGLAQHLRDEEYPIAFTLGGDTPGQAVAYLARGGLEQELLDPAATRGLDPTPGE